MNIDKEIQECLEKGPIRIGQYHEILIAVLDTGTKKVRVSSNRGALYLFLQLIAQTLDRPDCAETAQRLFPHPLGPLAIKEFDRLFLHHHYVKVYLEGNVIRIDQYLDKLPSPGSDPGRYIRMGGGLSFTLAVEDLKNEKLKIQPD